jgi:hypothetical protein
VSANQLCKKCTVRHQRKATTFGTPQPPRDADWVGEFDDMDTRDALSDGFGEGQLSAKAACCQARSAAIVGVEPTVRLTLQQAEAQPANASAATASAARTMAGLRVATGRG